MKSCCANKETELAETARKHRSLLWTVLVINLLMFFIEASFGWIGQSVALMGDSLDMLGDAATYGSSLMVVGMGIRQKAKVANLKAWIMMISGLVISAKCLYRSLNPSTPAFDIMFGVGLLALFMNLVCLFLLTRHKDDDINMRSVWVCSRNDIIANTSVLVAASLLWLTESPYPDIVVGLGLSMLFLKSSLSIMTEARNQTAMVSPVN